MTDKLISFETAKLAKEKGFNEYTFNYHCISEDYIDDDNDYYPLEVDYDFGLNNWNSSDNNFPISDLKLNWDTTDVFAVPTQSLLQKWLREKHEIIVVIDNWYNQPMDGKIYKFCFQPVINCENQINILCKTYEEALEGGLQ